MATETTQAPWVGRPLDRIDGPGKVAGQVRYAAEEFGPGTLFAHVVQSTVAKGRVRAADTAAAKAVPAVVAVWTCLDAPRLARRQVAEYDQPALKVLSPPYHVLQDPAVRYRGQEVGLVVAETSLAARHAASLVRLEYEEGGAALGFAEDAEAFTPDSLMVPLEPDYRRGDLAAGFAAAAAIVDAEYLTPAEHHAAIELGATVARFEGGKLTVHTTTQDIHGARLCLANSLSLPMEDIRVICRYLGGGFGGKNGTWPHTVLAAFAARELGRPVRLELTRQQMFPLHGHRARHRQHVRLGATADGRFTALEHGISVQTDAARRFVEHTGEASPMLYAVPNVAVSHRGVACDIPAPTIMRAPGAAPGMFALESAVDELAAALGIDPVELRLRNEPATDPETGKPWSSRALAAALREGAGRFGWERRTAAPRSMRDGRHLVGYGVASATYPANRLPCGARVRLSADGTATVETAGTDIGTGTYTILAQVAADALGLPPDRVRVALGDSALPKSPGSGGSWGAVSHGTAVQEACAALRANLGGATDLHGALKAKGLSEAVGEATATPPKEKKTANHAFGAHFVEVRVDPDTLEVRVPRMLGVFGVGRLVNAKTARSQLMGGMVWGLGMALTEATVLDERLGHFVNADLAEYHVPVNADVRDVEVVVLEESDALVSPLGAKGLGEIGIVGMAAAIANAVHHATGVRVRELPITIASLAGEA